MLSYVRGIPVMPEILEAGDDIAWMASPTDERKRYLRVWAFPIKTEGLTMTVKPSVFDTISRKIS